MHGRGTRWVHVLRELSLWVNPGAAEDDLRNVERVVGCALPADLRALLGDSDGVGDHNGHIVLNTAAMASVNAEMRSLDPELYMPLDALLFFGDEGNGDLFAFRILDGEIRGDEVFIWDHETDSRVVVSYGLERWLRERASNASWSWRG